MQVKKLDLNRYNNIVVFTGAGVSAPSGVPTFRGDDGYWNTVDVQKYMSADSFNKYPEESWEIINKLKTVIEAAKPNSIHDLLSRVGGTIITQNIDGFHQKAGSANVIEYHDNIHSVLCTECTFSQADYPGIICPECGSGLRPGVTLFNESPHFDSEYRAKRAMRGCDLFLVIGTSGKVTSLSTFLRAAQFENSYRIMINMDHNDYEQYFDESYTGPAQDILPVLLGVSG